jgi:hypothetical protein
MVMIFIGAPLLLVLLLAPLGVLALGLLLLLLPHAATTIAATSAARAARALRIDALLLRDR